LVKLLFFGVSHPQRVEASSGQITRQGPTDSTSVLAVQIESFLILPIESDLLKSPGLSQAERVSRAHLAAESAAGPGVTSEDEDALLEVLFRSDDELMDGAGDDVDLEPGDAGEEGDGELGRGHAAVALPASSRVASLPAVRISARCGICNRSPEEMLD
jgi:hypothetical protein